MKISLKIIFIFFPIIFLIALFSFCNSPVFNKKNIEIHQYDAMPLPDFFKKLFNNHYSNYKTVEASDYKNFCEEYSLKESDSLNQVKYFRVKFFQQLFTSQWPSNCSRKGAFKVPYFWNWVDPNPRSEIVYLSNGKKLVDVKPPSEFNKYSSMAYVDRIPSLYLKDLVSESPKYYHAGCDTFYTFGWCSEREMSFNMLMSFFKYDGKVIVNGAHSWSEFWTEFKTSNGTQKAIILKADNTYDKFESYLPDKNLTKASWLNSFGPDKYCKWYNEKARSASEKEKLIKTMVGKKASSRMEKQVIDYFF